MFTELSAMKKNQFIFCLFSAVFLGASVFVFPASALSIKTNAKAPVANAESQDSAIPRVDEKASCVVKECGDVFSQNIAPTSNENQFSNHFWIFLLGAYVFLLIFNFSFDFQKAKSPQWFWEAVFTFLAIFTWDNLDVARANAWFPGTLVEMAVIIYLYYLYFLRKKLKNKPA